MSTVIASITTFVLIVLIRLALFPVSRLRFSRFFSLFWFIVSLLFLFCPWSVVCFSPRSSSSVCSRIALHQVVPLSFCFPVVVAVVLRASFLTFVSAVLFLIILLPHVAGITTAITQRMSVPSLLRTASPRFRRHKLSYSPHCFCLFFNAYKLGITI